MCKQVGAEESGSGGEGKVVFAAGCPFCTAGLGMEGALRVGMGRDRGLNNQGTSKSYEGPVINYEEGGLQNGRGAGVNSGFTPTGKVLILKGGGGTKMFWFSFNTGA